MGGSGTSALTFGYTVVNGRNTPALVATAVNLNGATVHDGAGNAAGLSLTGLAQTGPKIQTTGPVVTASNVMLPQNDIVAASSLFSAGDLAGDPITQYSFYDNSRTASSGEFLLNGVAQPKGTYQPLFVSASQLSQVTFEAGAGGTVDDLYIAAYDGSVVSNITHLQVSAATPPAPVVTASNVTLPQDDIVAASSLFSVTNPAGASPTTQYSFYDNSRTASSGEFLLNGAAQPKGTYQPLFVNASQLSQVTFEAGAGGTADDLYIAAYDGSVVSNIAHLQVSAAEPPAPVVTALNVTLPQNDIVAASSLFSVINPAGASPTTQYSFYDNSRTASSGEFLLNGVAQPKGTYQPLFVSAAQLSQVTFEAGAGGTADDLYIAAYDGSVVSDIAHLQVSAAEPSAPAVTASNSTLPQDDIVAASSLFSVTNPVGASPITQYAFYDNSRTASSGEFLLNGVAQPKGTYQPLFVSASQLSQVTFEAGAGGTADDLYIAAYDGSVVSNIAHLQVSAAEPPAPVVTASNLTLPQDDIVAASSLFSVTNPAGASPTTQYSFYDDSRTASSGKFLLNGVAQPKGTYQPLFVSASQLSQVTFEAGAGGTADDLYIAAYDGSVVSNIAHLQVSVAVSANNTPFTIGAGQTVEIASPYSGVVAFASSTGTLKLDASTAFTGTVGGQLAIGDVIDLADITAGANATIGYTGNNSPGTLTVSDGTHTASIGFLGDYSLANFTASNDGHGGTSVVDPPIVLAQDLVGGLSQQMALLSQSLASFAPSDSAGSGRSDAPVAYDSGQLANLAQPFPSQQHA